MPAEDRARRCALKGAFVIGVAAALLSIPLGSPRAASAHLDRVTVGPALQPVSHASGWASRNWSGYAITGGPFTSITGAWTVPKVSATSNATFSSAWVGIDGFPSTNTTVIQTGTEQDYYNGKATYFAWWEIFPATPEEPISTITVHPGDHMTASIAQGTGTWTISITDTSTGQSYSTSPPYNGQRSSAEWIVEAPLVNGQQAKLAHYGSTVFDPGTVNGHSPGLAGANRGVMVQGGHQVSTPSKPDSDTDGFKIAYGSKTPAPPSS